MGSLRRLKGHKAVQLRQILASRTRWYRLRRLLIGVGLGLACGGGFLLLLHSFMEAVAARLVRFVRF